VSKYLTLSKEGLVPRMECPMDQGLLFCNQDLEDNIFLYCLSCNYKKTVGLKLYDKMVTLIDRIK
jgi:hypothetical protein